VYDGMNLIAVHDGVNLSLDNLLTRFVVPNTPAIGMGLGISVGVGFGVESMDHHIEFISAGCDLVV